MDSGTLERYIRDLSVTGLTSNPTIFNQAIKGSPDYNASIRKRLGSGLSRSLGSMRLRVGQELGEELEDLEQLAVEAELF